MPVPPLIPSFSAATEGTACLTSPLSSLFLHTEEKLLSTHLEKLFFLTKSSQIKVQQKEVHAKLGDNVSLGFQCKFSCIVFANKKRAHFSFLPRRGMNASDTLWRLRASRRIIPRSL